MGLKEQINQERDCKLARYRSPEPEPCRMARVTGFQDGLVETSFIGGRALKAQQGGRALWEGKLVPKHDRGNIFTGRVRTFEDEPEPVISTFQCFNNIASLLYCTPLTYEKVIEAGDPATTFNSENCCFISRDGTEHSARAVSIWVADHNGWRVVDTDIGNISHTCEQIEQFTNGGCDGNTYQTYFTTECEVTGDPTRVYVTENVTYREECLQLEKGDTGILYTETISHAGGGSTFDLPHLVVTPDYRGYHYYTTEYFWVHPDYPTNATPVFQHIAEISYSWTAQSFPSLAHQISGSGRKLTFGMDDGVRLVVEGQLPFCEGDFFTCEALAAEQTAPYGFTGSIEICIELTGNDASYISSAEQKDFARVAAQQGMTVADTDRSWAWELFNATFIATGDGGAWQLPQDVVDSWGKEVDPPKPQPMLVAAGLGFGGTDGTIPGQPANSAIDGLSPNLSISQAVGCCDFVYTRDLTVSPPLCEFRPFVPGEFDVEDDQGNTVTPAACYDWRSAGDSTPPAWPSFCHEQYSDDPSASISGSTIYLMDLAAISTALGQPVGTTTNVPITCHSFSPDPATCTLGAGVEKPFAVTGTGQAGVMAIAAGANRVRCRYGRK